MLAIENNNMLTGNSFNLNEDSNSYVTAFQGLMSED